MTTIPLDICFAQASKTCPSVICPLASLAREFRSDAIDLTTGSTAWPGRLTIGKSGAYAEMAIPCVLQSGNRSGSYSGSE